MNNKNFSSPNEFILRNTNKSQIEYIINVGTKQNTAEQQII